MQVTCVFNRIGAFHSLRAQVRSCLAFFLSVMIVFRLLGRGWLGVPERLEAGAGCDMDPIGFLAARATPCQLFSLVVLVAHGGKCNKSVVHTGWLLAWHYMEVFFSHGNLGVEKPNFFEY